MILIARKSHIYHMVTIFLLGAFLCGCDMPMRPEGIDVEGLTQIADRLRAQGDDVAAVDFYQRALQRVPKDARARRELAEILEAHNNYDEAASQYRHGLDLDPENGDLLKGLGRVLLKQGDPEAAKEQYEKVLRRESDDMKALNGLGVALDNLGNHAAAEQAYQQALADHPRDITTLTNLGHSYVLTGAYDQAIHILEPLAQDKVATPVLRQNLAEAYGMLGMEADAERMARMDLSPTEVKKNLAHYRIERAKLVLVPALYAELGPFSTEALASMQAGAVKNDSSEEVNGLLIEVLPEVKEIGGTPRFVVRVSGFSKSEKVRVFCDHLKKTGLSCHQGGL